MMIAIEHRNETQMLRQQAFSRSLYSGRLHVKIVDFTLRKQLLAAFILGALVVLKAGSAAASEEIRFATELVRALHQKGEPYIECAIGKMERRYQVSSVPWARAQLGTQHGEYDGFFVASQNSKCSQYAVFSEPFFNIEWLYVVKRGSSITLGDADFTQRHFEANLQMAFEKTDQDPASFQTFFAMSKPVGAYFGKEFLQREADFLESYNGSMGAYKHR